MKKHTKITIEELVRRKEQMLQSKKQKKTKELYVKFFIIFRYTDGIFYLNETNTNKDQDGRYIGYIAPKNNPFGEKEQVIYFPVKLLKKIV